MSKLNETIIQGSPGIKGDDPRGTSFLEIWDYVSKNSKDTKQRFIADEMLKKHKESLRTI